LFNSKTTREIVKKNLEYNEGEKKMKLFFKKKKTRGNEKKIEKRSASLYCT